jgi:nicotinate-nucleotide adenylyltransferase
MTAARIGILGGTFDPVHHGHLDAAAAAQAGLALDEIVFLPSHVPPHRQMPPRASGYDRFALIALAIQNRRRFLVSEDELTRDGPSFTIDTLRRLHQRGHRPSQLFFILGADAFAEIATWREYPDVLDAAHFAVVTRPGADLEAALARNPALTSRVRQNDHRDESGTGIFFVKADTPDVSSTAIRARLSTGQSIEDLVPAPVAAYIEAKDLYGTVNELHG